MSTARSNTRSRKPRGRRDVSNLHDKLPPHSLEAECAALGSMLLDPRYIGDVMDVIRSPEDFYKPSHAAIYEVLTHLYDRARTVDLVMLKDELAGRGMLDQVGGLEYLIELAEAVPNAASAVYYAESVSDHARKRELINVGVEIVESAHGPDKAADLLDRAEASVYAIQPTQSKQTDTAGIGSVLQDTWDTLEQAGEQGLRGIDTGFYALDGLTNGLHAGELTIIGARPSMGKSALVIQIAEYITTTQREHVCLFSLEMNRQEIALRLMALSGRVSMQKIRSNTMTQDEYGRLALAVGALTESPLLIDDRPGLSMTQLRARARRLKSKDQLSAVVIDYLQLMSCPGAENRREEVSAISRGLKHLARELQVPIVALSQLNRQAESRKENRPRMSDLRESGAVEQDADVIMLLHREDYYHRGEEGYTPTEQAELILEKNRQGPTGTVKLDWDGPTQRFGGRDEITAEQVRAQHQQQSQMGW